MKNCDHVEHNPNCPECQRENCKHGVLKGLLLEVLERRGALMAPDQRSVTDQLRDLVLLANQNGLYDAADWLQARLDQSSRVSDSMALTREEKS